MRACDLVCNAFYRSHILETGRAININFNVGLARIIMDSDFILYPTDCIRKSTTDCLASEQHQYALNHQQINKNISNNHCCWMRPCLLITPDFVRAHTPTLLKSLMVSILKWQFYYTPRLLLCVCRSASRTYISYISICASLCASDDIWRHIHISNTHILCRWIVCRFVIV